MYVLWLLFLISAKHYTFCPFFLNMNEKFAIDKPFIDI